MKLEDAASSTPDPERALNNLVTFCQENPDYVDRLRENIRPVSLLFSISQFQFNFASSRPEALFDAFERIDSPLDTERVRAALRKDFEEAGPSKEALMKVLRIFKKKMLLGITLRDILGKTDIVESMEELSLLADVLVGESLRILEAQMKETYGEPAKDAFSVISVGKLGSQELNFSSDIDLLYVYETEAGETAGIVTPQGIAKNRISNHEYYCKLGENLNKFLSLNTEDGFTYRVDLRLRPEGQKGSIAISLPAYEIYYESWGRVWERAVLVRARPMAGDANLGREFIVMIQPFVYRKYLDFSAIDEIRKMKTSIDERFKKDDIKRGYGGIREIEFFVHALQLIYGGKEPFLRERSTLRSLYRLLQKNLIGHGDYSILADNYRFLRKLEHRLQQLNDLQTHSLPSAESELTALGRKMGFFDGRSFLSELEKRRRMVRRIYNSFFTEGKTEAPRVNGETAVFFSEELSESEFRELLGRYKIADGARVIRNIQRIKESTLSFQTLRGQRLLMEILPAFLHEALQSRNPEAAINNLDSFATILSSEESYLDLFLRNRPLISTLVGVFSQSDYLSRTIIKRREYLDLLGHEMFAGKTLLSLKKDLGGLVSTGRPVAESIRIFRQMEEIRLGVLFLDGKIDAVKLMKGLSKVAEAVVSACVEELVKDGFVAIGMGKIGGRELTFDSDLDLIFASEKDMPESHVKVAERLIRLLTSYTQDGMAYRVDMRLRPDGTKGPLVSTLAALSSYYSEAAHFWEFQALLKARPVAGDDRTGCNFMKIREDILKKRGKDVAAADIKAMRERIRKELSREREGFDIKLGPGGTEELEFAVQYLQLIKGEGLTGLFVQGTLDAIKRLTSAGAVDKKDGFLLREAYIFYRKLESFMRLRGEPVLRKTGKDMAGTATGDASAFMGFGDIEDFLKHLEEKRGFVMGIFEKILK